MPDDLATTPEAPEQPEANPYMGMPLEKLKAIYYSHPDVGRPEWTTADNPTPEQKTARIQDMLATHAIAGRTWDEVKDNLDQHFPEELPSRHKQPYTDMQTDLKQHQMLQSAQAGLEGKEETAWSKAQRRTIPGWSQGQEIARTREYTKAVTAFNERRATEQDAATVANWQRVQETEAEEGSTYGGAILKAAWHLPAILGEFAAGGGLATKGIGLGLRAAGSTVAVPVMERLAGAGLRLAATTAAVPSMYVGHWMKENQENHRDPIDPRGFPFAYGMGLMNMLVLGSLQPVAGAILPGGGSALQGAVSAVGRQAIKGPICYAESVAADVIGKWAHLQSDYGSLQDFLDGKAGAGMRHATAQMFTFAAFGAIHEATQGSPAMIKDAYLKAIKDAEFQNAERTKLSPQELGRLLSRPGDVLDELYKQNPNPTRYEVQKAMEKGLSDPLALEWGLAVAKAFPEAPFLPPEKVGPPVPPPAAPPATTPPVTQSTGPGVPLYPKPTPEGNIPARSIPAAEWAKELSRGTRMPGHEVGEPEDVPLPEQAEAAVKQLAKKLGLKIAGKTTAALQKEIKGSGGEELLRQAINPPGPPEGTWERPLQEQGDQGLQLPPVQASQLTKPVEPAPVVPGAPPAALPAQTTSGAAPRPPATLRGSETPEEIARMRPVTPPVASQGLKTPAQMPETLQGPGKLPPKSGNPKQDRADELIDRDISKGTEETDTRSLREHLARQGVKLTPDEMQSALMRRYQAAEGERPEVVTPEETARRQGAVERAMGLGGADEAARMAQANEDTHNLAYKWKTLSPEGLAKKIDPERLRQSQDAMHGAALRAMAQTSSSRKAAQKLKDEGLMDVSHETVLKFSKRALSDLQARDPETWNGFEVSKAGLRKLKQSRGSQEATVQGEIQETGNIGQRQVEAAVDPKILENTLRKYDELPADDAEAEKEISTEEFHRSRDVETENHLLRHPDLLMPPELIDAIRTNALRRGLKPEAVRREVIARLRESIAEVQAAAAGEGVIDQAATAHGEGTPTGAGGGQAPSDKLMGPAGAGTRRVPGVGSREEVGQEQIIKTAQTLFQMPAYEAPGQAHYDLRNESSQIPKDRQTEGPLFIHELAHHLARPGQRGGLPLDPATLPADVRAGLAQFDYDPTRTNPGVSAQEGFAEWLRQRTTGTLDLSTPARKAANAYLEKMIKDANLSNRLDRLQGLFERFNAQDPIQQYGGTIGKDVARPALTPGESAANYAGKSVQSAQVRLLDDLAPAKQAEAAAEKRLGAKIAPGTKLSEVMAVGRLAAIPMAAEMRNGGMFGRDQAGVQKQLGRPLAELLKGVPAEQIPELERYMNARLDMMDKNANPQTRRLAQAAMDEFQKDPQKVQKLKAVADGLQKEVFEAGVDSKVMSGRLTAKEGKEAKKANPFQVDGKRLGLMDALERTYQDTARALNSQAKFKALVELSHQPGVGRWLAPAREGKGQGDVANGWVDGKPYHVPLGELAFREMVQGTTGESGVVTPFLKSLGDIAQATGIPKAIRMMGTILSPLWHAKNLIRDPILGVQRTVREGNTLRAAADLMAWMGKSFSFYGRAFLAGGADKVKVRQASDTMFQFFERQAGRQMEYGAESNQKTLASRVIDGWPGFFQRLTDFLTSQEKGTRIWELKNRLEQLGWTSERIQSELAKDPAARNPVPYATQVAALDIASQITHNVHQMGTDIRQLNRAWPFLGAHIAGVYKDLQTFRSMPAKALGGIAILAAAKGVEWLMNKDDKEYAELAPRLRDGFSFKTGLGWMHFPAPRGLDAPITGLIGETLRATSASSPRFNDLLATSLEGLGPHGGPEPMTTTVHAMANRSWTGRPIIPDREAAHLGLGERLIHPEMLKYQAAQLSGGMLSPQRATLNPFGMEPHPHQSVNDYYDALHAMETARETAKRRGEQLPKEDERAYAVLHRFQADMTRLNDLVNGVARKKGTKVQTEKPSDEQVMKWRQMQVDLARRALEMSAAH